MDGQSIKQASKQYPEIVILYVLATIMVVFCHVIQWSGLNGRLFNYLHQIVAAGVPLFLFISGFLTGEKKIINPWGWLKKKTIRIYIPFAIVTLSTLVSYAIVDDSLFDFKQASILLLNLQGLQNFLIINFDFYHAPVGLGHLWFSSIIVLCFAMAAIGSRFSCDVNRCKVVWIIGIILQHGLVFLHIELTYVLTFFAGYIANRIIREYATRHFALITCLMLVSLGGRIVLQRYFDNTDFYTYTVAPIQTSILGIWCFVAVFFFGRITPVLTQKIASFKIVQFIAGLTFEFYLVHSIVLAGAVNVFSFVSNKIIANIIAVLLTLLLAWIVHKISSWISRIISACPSLNQ